MEEYENKVNYLRHLKKIADIRGGAAKQGAFTNIFNIKKSRLKQSRCSPKNTIIPQRPETRSHTSTERIMRNFSVEKQNNRLLCKIVQMNSSISMKKYAKEYEQVKSLPINDTRIKRSQKYHYFKIFDINLHAGKASSPEDFYKIFLVQNRKKVLLVMNNLFELRRLQIRIKKGSQETLKIEGGDEEGIVKFSQDNLIDVLRHGQKIGHIVIEHVKK